MILSGPVSSRSVVLVVLVVLVLLVPYGGRLLFRASTPQRRNIDLMKLPPLAPRPRREDTSPADGDKSRPPSYDVSQEQAWPGKSLSPFGCSVDRSLPNACLGISLQPFV
ncbi:unnamed protein product [Pleuronectes platessa]|uniref:Uncharacterized protein n=1 Tax=Pleuronectes platessa TaxID=8262 RepID=A0A9N7UQ05_PLEPL|nr:unnamed protein product [Pleuronectes platessa]